MTLRTKSTIGLSRKLCMAVHPVEVNPVPGRDYHEVEADVAATPVFDGKGIVAVTAVMLTAEGAEAVPRSLLWVSYHLFHA